MLVPLPSVGILRRVHTGRRWASRLRLALLVLLSCSQLYARNPQPVTRIPLDQFGFQPLIAQFLLDGSSLLTLHYVDDSHLLLTFNSRRLITRIPGDPLEDRDRTVDALLLELPSGRVLARTEWRLHDHGQYLWSLDHGHFLLRIRNTVTTFAPLDNLEKGDPFIQQSFLRTSRKIVTIRLSPLADFVTVETVESPSVSADPDLVASSLQGPAAPFPPSDVQLNFYRLTPPGPTHDRFIPRVAGFALSKQAVDLPVNATGYLRVLDQGHQRWAFDFKPYTGKVLELALYDSTCRPYPIIVSASEFVTFGCHGDGGRQQLAAFNFRGDQMWEQTLSGSYLSPSIAYAPVGGRFALGRLIVTSAAISTDSLTPAEVASESVDVYQIASGKILLHVECTPTARAGQNFTFSPDGLNFAIIHDSAIEIHRLPALSPRDQTAIKLAATSAPAPNDAPVNVTGFASKTPPEDDATAETPPIRLSEPPAKPTAAEQTPPSALADTASDEENPTPTPPPAADRTSAAGDPPPEKPRKPPTLYEPGEAKPK